MADTDSKTPSGSNLNWENMHWAYLIGPGAEDHGSNVHKHKITQLKVSEPEYFLHTTYINGIQVNSSGIKSRMRARNLALPNWKLDGVCINVELDNDYWYFVDLEKYFDGSQIKKLSNWVEHNNCTLLKIGNEYQKHGKLPYHFLYEIMSLFNASESISEEQQKDILKDTQNALSLFHNRILAEISSEYSKTGYALEFYPNNNHRMPDLKMNNVFIDVKTILITDVNKSELLSKFAKKLRDEIIDREKKKNQVGNTGVFFIGLWSAMLNSIIHTAFEMGIFNEIPECNAALSDTAPALDENMVVFVLPRSLFKNYYLLFNKSKVCDAVDYLANTGYCKILELDYRKHMLINIIREGYEFGTTGNHVVIPISFT